MKRRPNQALKELRRIVGRTQTEFAAMIGASKDTVVSWELGRNKLSESFSRRIYFATGVDEEALLQGKGPLWKELPFVGRVPYTKEEFDRHRSTMSGRTDEEAARHHLERCVDALELIFMAAAVPGGGRIGKRLPAVVDSFVQWCERTVEDFRLGPQIDPQLAKRRFKYKLTLPYGEWRRLAKEDQEVTEVVQFRDDRRRGATEMLTIEVDAMPGWAPGRLMKGTQPSVVDIR